jgi:hypothetical protein
VQNSITEFLRNHLTGSPDYQGTIQDVILIPVGERTSLGKSLRGLNKQFDELENILTSRYAQRVINKQKPAARMSDPAPRVERAESKRVSGSKAGMTALAETALGLALGAVASVVLPNITVFSKQIGIMYDGAGNALDSAKNFATKAYQETKSYASSAWNYVSGSAESIWNHTKSGATNLWEGLTGFSARIGTSMLEATSNYDSMVDKEGRKNESHNALDQDKSAKIPTSANRYITDGVSAFWSKSKQVVKDWLHTIFGVAQDSEAVSRGANSTLSSGGGVNTQSLGGGGGNTNIRGSGRPGSGGGNSASSNRTASTDTVPGTSDASSGYKSIDSKMGKMSAPEREAYRKSDGYESDKRQAATEDGVPLGVGKFVGTKSNSYDGLGDYRMRKHTEAQYTEQKAAVYQAMKAEGFSDKAIAKAMGSTQSESKFDPGVIAWGDNKKNAREELFKDPRTGRMVTTQDSFGMFQMNGDRLKNLVKTAKEKGLNPWDIQAQTSAFHQEVDTTHKTAGNILRNDAEDVRIGGTKFGKVYEGYSGGIQTARGEQGAAIEKEIAAGKYNGYDFSGKTSNVGGPTTPQLLGPIDRQGRLDANGIGRIGKGAGFGDGITPNRPTTDVGDYSKMDSGAHALKTIKLDNYDAKPVKTIKLGDYPDDAKATSKPDTSADEVKPSTTEKPQKEADDTPDKNASDGKSDVPDDVPDKKHRKPAHIHSDVGLLVVQHSDYA